MGMVMAILITTPEPSAMKRLSCSIFIICFTLHTFAQQILVDEMLQARVHYMNTAKVSYITSADVFRVSVEPQYEPEIPNDILQSFEKKYKGARKVEWTIKEDRYKINFIFKGSEMFTYLDRHGLWMKSFTKLSQEELPEQVVSYLESQYQDYQLTKYYLKDTPSGQSYTVAVKGNSEYVWLEFDENGHILNSPA